MGQKVMLIDSAAIHALIDEQIIVIIPYAQLTLAILKDHLPDSIMLPLFGDGFDAVDALARLTDLGFSGPVAVIVPPLPNLALIARELSSAAPGMIVTLRQAIVQT